MMVGMDTKFGRIYCAISDARNLLYFQLQLPQHYIKSEWGIQKHVLEFKKNCF